MSSPADLVIGSSSQDRAGSGQPSVGSQSNGSQQQRDESKEPDQSGPIRREEFDSLKAALVEMMKKQTEIMTALQRSSFPQLALPFPPPPQSLPGLSQLQFFPIPGSPHSLSSTPASRLSSSFSSPSSASSAAASAPSVAPSSAPAAAASAPAPPPSFAPVPNSSNASVASSSSSSPLRLQSAQPSSSSVSNSFSSSSSSSPSSHINSQFNGRQQSVMGVREGDREFIESLASNFGGPGGAGATNVSNYFASLSDRIPQSKPSIAPTLIRSEQDPGAVDSWALLKSAVASSRNTKHPFKTIEEFHKALKTLIKTCQDADAKDAWVDYVDLVLKYARIDLDAAQDYHYYVYDAHLKGKHLITTEGGCFHAQAFAEFLLPVVSRAQQTHSTSSIKTKAGSGSGGGYGNGKVGGNKRKSGQKNFNTDGEFPAGSCTVHPNATTHDTASCRSKKAGTAKSK
jgi:hypothetical protein